MPRISTAALLCIALVCPALSGACAGDEAGGQHGTAVPASTAAAPPTATAPPTSEPPAAGDPALRGPFAVGLTHLTFERSDRDGAPRVLDTWVWYPAAGASSAGAVEGAAPANGGPFPLVVFSHGSGGQPDNATFLTEHLASWGYVVAAPPHPGNTSDDCVICGIDVIIRSAGERLLDVPFVFDELARAAGAGGVAGIIDLERTAIAGHSFGGWTAVFQAADGRFDAAIAMAPGQPLLALEPARRINVPLLLIAGERDEIVDPGHVRTLRDEVPDGTPLTYVSYPDGRHLTFIDSCFGCVPALDEAAGHTLTRRYVTAFLQVYLAGDERYAPFLDSQPPEAVVERQ
jgi:predicted dienelactone hydrolase